MKTWRWPALLAVLTVVGLLSALLGGEGPWRVLSWVTLSVPLAIVLWSLLRSLMTPSVVNRRS